MPFPKVKVRFNRCFGTCPRLVSIVDPDTGVVTESLEPCNSVLPDSSNFEIQNMVKAGVTLGQVNTKILGSSVNLEDLASAVDVLTPENNKNED